MINMTVVTRDGTLLPLAARTGVSTMEALQAAGIEGVSAECGGAMACATCHVFFDEATIERIGPPEATEEDMLDFAATQRTGESRLSCQVVLSDALEGAIITIPETQV
ncbi:2Fe-2S iron-sulfur cluster-binding protein (plasmid) [Shimia sp. W99]